jgi:ABC-2 type transport system permease protein
MRTLLYTRYELLRLLRNRRLLVFSLGFPLALYYAIAAPNRGEQDLAGAGISAPVYFMVGLAAFGTMNTVLGVGGRIAGERTIGWSRQLRLSPLPSGAYFTAKLLTAYAGALLTIGALYAAGATLDVRLGAGDWAAMTFLLLVGLTPFAALGVLMGHLLTSDTVGPAIGGVTALLALLGGAWYPITGGTMQAIAEALPSYWLVQASHVGLGGHAWGATGWAVVCAWSVAAAVAAAWAYRRDTQRVPA